MIIPTVIDSDGRTDRVYDIYSRLLEDRIIYLGDEVNHQTANLVVAQLLFLESKDPHKDITLYINSPGGSVSDGLAIYDTMNFIKSDVSTVGMGLQASMGAFLLSSGAKGKRYVLPNSRVMIHQVSSGTQGTATDMEISLKETIRLKKLLNEIMAKNTGQKLSKVEVDAERDFWMTAEEAVAYGVADKIINTR
jgi:ATP-dependent Clp protease protease subunit